jgi:hypothetical protein
VSRVSICFRSGVFVTVAGEAAQGVSEGSHQDGAEALAGMVFVTLSV